MERVISPRLLKPLNCSIIDFRRPFSELNFLSQFDSLLPLSLIFAHVRQLGCRCIVMEEIHPSVDVDGENLLIIKQFPKFKFFSQKRLTFWTSSLSKIEDIESQTDRSFLGYVILRQESFGSENEIPKWNILESVLRPPSGDNVFIPRYSSFQVRCASKFFSVQGILFCGQDGAFKTCAITSLRSFSSYMLDRDVSYNEILQFIPSCDPSHGLTIKQISNVLYELNIGHNRVKPSKEKYYTANELIHNAISARSGVLVAFTIGSELGHLLFIYGYTLNPLSVQFSLGAAYFPEDYNQGFYNTIAQWIDNFICTDDNFGPYCYLPPKFSPLHQPEILITAFPPDVKLDGTQATVTAFGFLNDLISSLEETKPNKWLSLLIEYLEKKQVIFNSVLMEKKEYISYISTVRDWENNCENPKILNALRRELPENKLWIIEFTIPDLIKSYFKLGEIVLDTGSSVDLSEKTFWNSGILARLPSIYAFPRENNKMFITSGELKSQTPFFQGGESRRIKMESGYKYQIALSFAGEDRAYAEELAEILSSKNISVFYDKYEKAQLWGKDLYQHLQKVYKDMAQYCVVFLSNSYAEKLWTKHELKQAQARAFKESEEYILPIKIDSTEIPGINETIGYIDLREDSISTVADLILQKLGI